MTFAELLAENGASPEDIKLLDTPVARKAFDKQQAQVAAAVEAQRKADDLVKRNQQWATEVETQNQAYLRERDSAKIEAAAAAAVVSRGDDLYTGVQPFAAAMGSLRAVAKRFPETSKLIGEAATLVQQAMGIVAYNPPPLTPVPTPVVVAPKPVPPPPPAPPPAPVPAALPHYPQTPSTPPTSAPTPATPPHV